MKPIVPVPEAVGYLKFSEFVRPIEHATVSLTQPRFGQRQPSESVIDVGVGTGQIDHQVEWAITRGLAIDTFEGPVQLFQVSGVVGPVGKVNIQIAG